MKKGILSTVIKFYQDHKFYIFPALVSLSSLFLIIFVVYPQALKLISNQKVSADINTKSSFLESKAQALESYNVTDLSKKVELALAAYPAEKELGSAIGLMQQIAARSGYIITSMSLANSAQKVGNSDSFEIKLEMKGDKASFQALLNNLENAERLIKISGLDTQSAPGNLGFNVSITVQMLYAQLPQNFGAIDSSVPQLSEQDEARLVSLEKMRSNVLVAPPTSLSPRGKANPFE